jgi:hypothetical protein
MGKKEREKKADSENQWENNQVQIITQMYK